MNSVIKIKKFLFIGLLLNVLSLHSQNIKSQNNFVSGNDVFGTRSFIENKNQFNKAVKTKDKICFALENGKEKIYFTNKGVIYSLVKKQRITQEMFEAIEQGEKVETKPDDVYLIEMNWANANPDVQITSSEKQNHYFTYGGTELNSNTFKKITYKNIYSGIDFEYTIPDNKEYGIKYNVVIHPGANPNDIKMVYSGDIKKISLNSLGEVIIKTPSENITEHAPITFCENNQTVASIFTLTKNTISFTFPNGFDNSKTLIIDPWITTVTTLQSTNYAFDVDYDFAGNLYVYGGNDPYKLAKYNSSGVLQWTFSGSLITPAWNSGPYAGNFVVNKSDGKIYIGQGYIYSGTSTIRLTNTGNYDNFITNVNPNWNECWDMGFNSLTGNVYAFGGGQSGNLSAGIIDQITSSVSTTAFFPSNPFHGQDISNHVIDSLGNVFVYYSQGTDSTYLLNNRVVLLNPTFTGIIWNQPSTYTTLAECKNKSSYIGSGFIPGINSSNGFNCLAVNSNYLFFYDGLNLAAYNKATGLKVGSTTIAGNKPLEQGGIAVDDCNKIYIGGKGSLLSYNFIDSTFIASVSIPIGTTTSNKYVYDIRIDKKNKLIYYSGSGFAGIYDLDAFNNHPPINIKVCTGTILQLNAPPSTSYSWIGPNGFTSSLSNPSVIITSPAMSGTYSVTIPAMFCSSSNTAITIVNFDSINTNIVATPKVGFAPLNVDFSNSSVLPNNNSSIITTSWSYGNGITTNSTVTYGNYILNGIPTENTIYQSAGSYTAQMVITQKSGTLICTGTASVVINVELPSNIEIPNTFTPNGDGINDIFFLQTTNLTEITCLIFDRWGVKMYETTSDKGNIAWDGKNLSGKEVPAGTYFYIIKAKGKDGKETWNDADGKEIPKNGIISLFR